MQVAGFDWDHGNLFKNESKHGLSREVIETFFYGKIWVAPDLKHSSSEDRFLAIGTANNGRPVVVAFTFREKDGAKLIRPISARYMHLKEMKRYEQAFTEDEK
jgi:hypothetical protein